MWEVLVFILQSEIISPNEPNLLSFQVCIPQTFVKGLEWRKGLSCSLSHPQTRSTGVCSVATSECASYVLHSSFYTVPTPAQSCPENTNHIALYKQRAKKSDCGSFNPNSHGTNLLKCFIVIITSQIPSRHSLIDSLQGIPEFQIVFLRDVSRYYLMLQSLVSHLWYSRNWLKESTRKQVLEVPLIVIQIKDCVGVQNKSLQDVLLWFGDFSELKATKVIGSKELLLLPRLPEASLWSLQGTLPHLQLRMSHIPMFPFYLLNSCACEVSDSLICVRFPYISMY